MSRPNSSNFSHYGVIAMAGNVLEEPISRVIPGARTAPRGNDKGPAQHE